MRAVKLDSTCGAVETLRALHCWVLDVRRVVACVTGLARNALAQRARAFKRHIVVISTVSWSDLASRAVLADWATQGLDRRITAVRDLVRAVVAFWAFDALRLLNVWLIVTGSTLDLCLDILRAVVASIARVLLVGEGTIITSGTDNLGSLDVFKTTSITLFIGLASDTLGGGPRHGLIGPNRARCLSSRASRAIVTHWADVTLIDGCRDGCIGCAQADIAFLAELCGVKSAHSWQVTVEASIARHSERRCKGTVVAKSAVLFVSVGDSAIGAKVASWAGDELCHASVCQSRRIRALADVAGRARDAVVNCVCCHLHSVLPSWASNSLVCAVRAVVVLSADFLSLGL